jgi:23S rRNA C2498 (ribose-2'-O)-methylase RlmM
MGVTGLQGCTTLIVTSQAGVYMSHWMETRAFSADVSDTNRGKPKVDFTREVLNPLRSATGGTSHMSSLVASAPLLQNAKVFLVPPQPG